MLKGDCNKCIYRAADPADKVCVECGIARKNYEEETMAEYISSEAVLENVCFDCCENGGCNVKCAEYLAMKAIHAADAVEVRHGRWVERKSMLYCSECGCGFDRVFHLDLLYCPHCGAKMDESEGERNV